MPSLALKATHKPVQNYYAALRQFDDLGVSHEGAVKSAVHNLLTHCARQRRWTVVPEFEVEDLPRHRIRPDAALLDEFRYPHRYWEANRPDEPEYLVRLLGQVIAASLERVKVLKGLPELRVGGV